MPEYVMSPQRVVCRDCHWGETYDPEWPHRTAQSACPRCKKRRLVWMSFEGGLRDGVMQAAVSAVRQESER